MKIKSVKVYNSVYLGKKLYSFFSDQPSVAQSHRQIGPLEFEFLPGIGIRVDSAEDAIVIPFPNVENVQLVKEDKQQAGKKKTKSDTAE